MTMTTTMTMTMILMCRVTVAWNPLRRGQVDEGNVVDIRAEGVQTTHLENVVATRACRRVVLWMWGAVGVCTFALLSLLKFCSTEFQANPPLGLSAAQQPRNSGGEGSW